MMGPPITQPAAPPAAGRPPRPWPPAALARRRPFVTFFLLALLSNASGSVFNIVYNHHLIVKAYLNAAQQDAWPVLVLAYNLAAYPLGLWVLLAILRPLSGCLSCLRAGRPIAPARLERCRRLLVNLPAIQVGVNFLCWAPGAVVFPLALCGLGGWGNAWPIWQHFAVSFLVAALLTTVQTFFLLEWFLMQVVYADFFKDDRPADVRGAWRISLRWRLVLYWTATAVVPLLALLAVALNFTQGRLGDFALLRQLSLGVAGVSVASSALIAWLVGSQLVGWVGAHTAATERVTEGDYGVRIAGRRPDELGRLTDRFNDMCAALERAQVEREVFGEVVGPDARDEMLDSRGLGGEVREVTVLFADIRGFTHRSAGEAPEQAVDLLNRFLTHAVAAVQGQNGHVNKFLGDGILALFGAPRKQADHADRAVRAALELLTRLSPPPGTCSTGWPGSTTS